MEQCRRIEDKWAYSDVQSDECPYHDREGNGCSKWKRPQRCDKGNTGQYDSGELNTAVFDLGRALTEDFRTIDWAKEYPFPTSALKELQDLLLT